MVVPVDCVQPKEAANVSTNNNAKCEASDESEYSSLEDDDDIQSECSDSEVECGYFSQLQNGQRVFNLYSQVEMTAMMIIP